MDEAPVTKFPTQPSNTATQRCSRSATRARTAVRCCFPRNPCVPAMGAHPRGLCLGLDSSLPAYRPSNRIYCSPSSLPLRPSSFTLQPWGEVCHPLLPLIVHSRLHLVHSLLHPGTPTNSHPARQLILKTTSPLHRRPLAPLACNDFTNLHNSTIPASIALLARTPGPSPTSIRKSLSTSARSQFSSRKLKGSSLRARTQTASLDTSP